MVSDRSQRQKPPYVSYKTFQTFLIDMKSGVPARIDRGYLNENSKSGSTATQLLAALRFFELVSVEGLTTPRLSQLANAALPMQAELLRQFGTRAYDFVFSAIDTKTASYGQLSDTFKHNFDLADDVVRKCAKFFISFANVAGIPLSQRITRKKLHATASTRTNAKTKKNANTAESRTKQNSVMPNTLAGVSMPGSWCQLCIEATFPRFDLDWTAEQRSKWFDAFRELVAMNPASFGVGNGREA